MGKFLDHSGLSYLVSQLKSAIAEKADADIALYKIPQELTLDEADQVRENIHSIGKSVAGFTMTPYTVEEDSSGAIVKTPLSPVVAESGAEIYNDYENNIATGLHSIAAGGETQATGLYAHANGWYSIASGGCSTASGLLTKASGHFTHAEGTRTQATANNAHSEGDLTQATGRQSHSEGVKTIASGENSHAEGNGTKASGGNAHAEGRNTVASGLNSHAEGFGTIAAGANQTAMGKYNVSDTTSLLIIGNGTSDTDRSNALKVDASGNVYTGSANAKLATESYVSDQLQTLTTEEIDAAIEAAFGAV